jgi:phosphopantothenoylcysteine decarboxylase/phosphopantothenate--cysteine ligase
MSVPWRKVVKHDLSACRNWINVGERWNSLARILITSGPTRQYLDPVRYLTNASSGRMGAALAFAAVAAGHEVIVVSGPVEVDYPAEVELHQIVSTEEMLCAAEEAFSRCDGMIGVAAPCDYRPRRVEENKIAKTGEPLVLHLIETPDIVATLGAKKEDRWVVGFALQSDDHRFKALRKLEQKSCDLIVLNEPSAMDSHDNTIEVLNGAGEVVLEATAAKTEVARQIFTLVESELIGS